MAGQDPRDHADSVELIDLDDQAQIEDDYVPEVAPVDNAAQEAEADRARAQAEVGDQLPRRLFTAAIPPVPPPASGRKRFAEGDDGPPEAGEQPPPADDEDDDDAAPVQPSEIGRGAAGGPPAPVASRTAAASPWARRPENGS
jgi:hypothetical protein